MQCEYGGEVTFTHAAEGYRLRLFAGATLSVVLSKADVEHLMARMQDVLKETHDADPMP